MAGGRITTSVDEAGAGRTSIHIRRGAGEVHGLKKKKKTTITIINHANA